MKSTIKIEIDHDNLPIIHVNHQKSDDVRDKMISVFYRNIFTDGLPGNGLCLVQLIESSENGFRINLRPLNVEEILKEPVPSLLEAAKKESANWQDYLAKQKIAAQP